MDTNSNNEGDSNANKASNDNSCCGSNNYRCNYQNNANKKTGPSGTLKSYKKPTFIGFSHDKVKAMIAEPRLNPLSSQLNNWNVISSHM